MFYVLSSILLAFQRPPLRFDIYALTERAQSSTPRRFNLVIKLKDLMCTKTWRETQQVYCLYKNLVKVDCTDLCIANCTHCARVGRRDKVLQAKLFNLFYRLSSYRNTPRKTKKPLSGYLNSVAPSEGCGNVGRESVISTPHRR